MFGGPLNWYLGWLLATSLSLLGRLSLDRTLVGTLLELEQWTGYPGEWVIVAQECKQSSDFSNVRWLPLLQLQHCFQVSRVYLNTIAYHQPSNVPQLALEQITLLQVKLNTLLAEMTQHFSQFLHVGLKGFGEAKNVIQIGRTAFIPQTSQDTLHTLLTCCQSIGKAKGEVDPFIELPLHAESNQASTALFDEDLVVGTSLL